MINFIISYSHKAISLVFYNQGRIRVEGMILDQYFTDLTQITVQGCKAHKKLKKKNSNWIHCNYLKIILVLNNNEN